MYNINSTLNGYKQNLADVNLVGSFIGNQDQPRFLNQNDDIIAFKSALTWILMSEGIPIIYYGEEQGFSGGSDPNNREPLWTTRFNTSSELYQWIKLVVDYRKSARVWNYQQIQRYVDDSFYAFSRGNTFVATTNQKQNLSRNITYQPYPNGTKICNLYVKN